MTVKQLIEELTKYPDDMRVFFAERKTDFTYGLVNSLRCDEIDIIDDPYCEGFTKEDVIILDEE